MALDIGIKLNLEGYDGVMADLQKLDSYVKSHKRTEISLNLDKAKREVMAYRGEVNKLKAELQGMSKDDEGWEKKNAELKEAQGNLKRATLAVSELSSAMGKLKQQMTFGQAFKKISTWAAHTGSAMQSMGNALTKFNAPFKRFTTGILYGAGYKALNMVLSGFGGAFERYDTMQNYAKSLEALGLDANKTFKVFKNQEKAMTAIENLNESVLGLPTGLDEIVASQKMFAGATGEMEKSTKAAIATNNAFLASGMGSREQRFLQKYMVSLASGAELASTQWQSMGRIAPLVMRAVAEELDYGGDKFKQFNEDLQDGTIAGEEFLNAFIKVGTEGKVQQAANVMKSTWSGLAANLQNATKRMGENILKTLDDIMVGYNGRNLIQNLLGFDAEGNEVGGGLKHFINGISESLQGWVKAHPEEIMDFIETIKSVDWASLIRGIGQGMLMYARMFEMLGKFAGGKDLSWIPKLAMGAGAFGRILTITGGLLKGSRHILGLLGASGFMAIRGLRGGGLIGRIMQFFGGKNPAQTIGPAPTMANTLRSTFKNLQGAFTLAGGIAIAMGTAWGLMKTLKSIIKDAKEIGDLAGEVDWGTVGAAVSGFATIIGVFSAASYSAGKVDPGTMLQFLKGEAFLGAIITFADLIAAANMRLIKDSFKSLADISEYLNTAMENFNKLKELSDTGGVVSKIKTAISSFNEVIGVLQPESTNHVLGTKTDGLKKLSKSAVKSLNNLGDALGAIKNSVGLINEVNALDVKSDNVESVTSSLASALQFIAGMYDRLPESIKSGKSKGTSESMLATVQNIKDTYALFLGKKGVLAQIPKITEGIQGLVTNDENFSTFGANMDVLSDALENNFTKLTGAFQDINPANLLTKMTDLVEAMKQIRKGMKQLNKINNTEYNLDASKISTFIDNLKGELNADSINEVHQQVALLHDAVQSLLDSVAGINGTAGKGLDIKIKLNSKISGLSTVLSDIKNVQDKIQAAVNSIKTYYTKTIHVHVTNDVSRDPLNVVPDDGSYGPLKPSYSQNGGTVYRAKGGSIFKPRGTDIVPAMLTPGEFVHSRKAVDYFGRDFMNRVNALDVKGAMKALMARGGNVTTSLNRQNVVNNTINNNQRVTQNINTNNPSMSKMSLGRFAGAL